MEASKPESMDGCVRKRESKLRQPKNYSKTKCAPAGQPKNRNTTCHYQPGLSYNQQITMKEEKQNSCSIRDHYDTPDVVSSCDSKVIRFIIASQVVLEKVPSEGS